MASVPVTLPDAARLLAAAPGAYLVLEVPGWRIVGASDAYLAATGAQRAAIVGRGLFDAFPDDPDEPFADGTRVLRASIERCVRLRRPDRMAVQRYPVPRATPDGVVFEERWWQPENVPVLASDGVVTHVIHAVEDVTDPVRREGTLREHTSLLRLAGVIARVGGWSLDRTARSFLWSDETAALHGWPAGSTPSLDDVLRTLEPDDAAAARTAFDAALEDGRGFNLQVRARGSDGRARTLRWIGEPAFEDRRAHVRGAVQDVTDLADTYRALAASEARFRAVARATSDVVWDWDATQGTIWWGDGVERLTGRPSDALAGHDRRWERFIHPDDRDRVVAELDAAIAAGASEWEATYRYLHADGRALTVHDRGVILRDEAGRAVRMVGGPRDVTEIEAARSRIRRLAHLLDRANDAIVVRRLDHTIEAWNQGATRLYGWRLDEAIGSRVDDLLYGPDQRSAFEAATRAVRDHGEWTGRIEQRRRDGGRVTVDARWTLVEDDDAAPVIVAINSDATERVALEDRLRQAQRLESLGHLTGGVAHDFNNLLTVVLGTAESLLADLDPASRTHAQVRLVLAAAERGADLTQRLLAFARRQPLQPRAFDAAAHVRAAETLLARALGEGVALTVDADGEHPIVVDPTQFEAALLNLAFNARDALPHGGRVAVRVAGDAEVVEVRVHDDGVGIDPAHLDRVFDPFFTTKPSGRGAGLGLSSVYGFVTQSGGRVAIASRPGEGTEVALTVPRAARLDATPPGPAGPARRGAGEVVLVVEDDPGVRAHVEGLLRAFGYRVRTAADPDEALAAARADPPPALLFSDVMLGGGASGPVLAERLRHERPDLAVLFTSGYAADALVRDGRLASGVRLLPKPYHRDELARAVRAALDASAAPPSEEDA